MSCDAAAALFRCGGEGGTYILRGDLESYEARRDFSLAKNERVSGAGYLAIAE